MATTITQVTQSCVLFDFDGQVLLTDPWFSEKRGYYRGEPPDPRRLSPRSHCLRRGPRAPHVHSQCTATPAAVPDLGAPASASAPLPLTAARSEGGSTCEPAMSAHSTRSVTAPISA